MVHGFRSCLVAIGLVLLGGCQPAGQPLLASGEMPIWNGVPDEDPAHDAVVYITWPGFACSGTWIGDRVVLTAAHCVLDIDPASYTVMFTNNAAQTPAERRRRVSETAVHPSYNDQTFLYDIAVLRLDSDAPAGVTPIPHLPHRIGLTSADLGLPVTFVGFGVTETGGSGVKMKVVNEIDCVCDGTGQCTPDCRCPSYRTTFCHDFDPGGTCSGDSGGPALVLRNGEEYVAGVTSFGDDVCPDATYSFSTTVDEYEPFINQFSGGALGTACSRDDMCRSGHCVDGVCCQTDCNLCASCAEAGSEGTCRPLADGTPCPDPNKCNGEEVCRAGFCEPGDPLVCQDSVGCTLDSCDPDEGCVFLPRATDCDDFNACTRDICDAQAGCVFLPLEEGLGCGSCKLCRGGACVDDPSCEGGSGCGSSPGFGLWMLPGLLLLSARRFTG